MALTCSSSCKTIGCLVALTLAMVTLTLAMPVEDYLAAREALLKEDQSRELGRNLTLSADEQIVSDFLVGEKKKLIEMSRIGRDVYYPSLSFYQSKPQIDKSPIFKIIRKMPKGAALHLHDLALTSLDWLVSNATYRDNLYMCSHSDSGLLKFKFFKNPPALDNNCTWQSVKKARSSASSYADFDASIKKNISLLASDPFTTYPSLTRVWNRFDGYFEQVIGLIFYEPVFRDYFRQALAEFTEDSVQYFEMRGMFSAVYDLDGNQYNAEDILKMYIDVRNQFLQNNHDFFGAKFIMSSIRTSPRDDILSQVKTATILRGKYPDSLLGYDLVGQEDPAHSLLYYKEQLLQPQQQLPYFFHAAETNWQGTATDYNLIDALLLNTTRIGHGFGLIKHPKLVSLVREKAVAIEVNPVSNQLLGLVKDLRNHALVPLMLDDFPVVVSSDDPATWEANPLSHDFFLAFMNMCGEDADLRFLKQLAINSIKYSAMTPSEKKTALTFWQKKWQEFITNTVTSLKHGGN